MRRAQRLFLFCDLVISASFSIRITVNLLSPRPVLVVTLNFKHKLHDMGHLLVIKIKSEEREYSVFGFLGVLTVLNGSR